MAFWDDHLYWYCYWLGDLGVVMETVLSIAYFVIGFILSTVVLVRSEKKDGTAEGLAVITMLFWPFILLVALPFGFAHLFGWRCPK